MPTRKLAVRGVIGAAAVLSVLVTTAGCSSSSPSAEGSTDAPSGELQILVSSASASDAAFEAVNTAFEAKYPDVDVVFSTVDNSTYAATKSSRLTAGNVDIVVLKDFQEAPDYAADSTSEDVLLAQAGGLLDLSDQDFLDKYTPSVIESQQIDGKTYAVPTGLSYTTGVYYNKATFDQLGLSVPTTWSEFVDVADALTAAGVTPIGMGGKDGWPAGLPMLGAVASLYPTAADKQELAKGLWDGSVKLTDDKPLEILEKTQTVYGYAQDNFAGAGYDEIPAGFAAGDYAMVLDGTWNAPTIETAVAGAFDIGYFPFPASDDAADNALLAGKVELTLGVAASTTNETAALAWLDFFSDPTNYESFVETSGFSSAQPDIPTSDFLQSISQYTATFEAGWSTYWFPNNNAGQDAVYPFNYPALSPLGSSTAEEAAESAQTAWAAAF